MYVNTHKATKQISILKDDASFWNSDRKLTQKECPPFSLLNWIAMAFGLWVWKVKYCSQIL